MVQPDALPLLHSGQFFADDSARDALVSVHFVCIQRGHAVADDCARERAASQRNDEDHGPQQCGTHARMVHHILYSIQRHHEHSHMHTSLWQDTHTQRPVADICNARGVLGGHHMLLVHGERDVFEGQIGGGVCWHFVLLVLRALHVHIDQGGRGHGDSAVDRQNVRLLPIHVGVRNRFKIYCVLRERRHWFTVAQHASVSTRGRQLQLLSRHQNNVV